MGERNFVYQRSFVRRGFGLIAVGASVGWLVFGEFKTSEAVHFDESVPMVQQANTRPNTQRPNLPEHGYAQANLT